MRNPKNRGFSLVEILIVIVVLAILAAVTVLAYNGYQKRAQTSSLKHDMRVMDVAQKNYMAQSGGGPLTYNEAGAPNDILAFIASRGNSVIVRLKDNHHYCVYGYNPGSNYPTPELALIYSSNDSACQTLDSTSPGDPSNVFSTVAIIGQRLEEFYRTHGYYPQVDQLIDIGLVIKPNSTGANQQQLYCRNDSEAIYLQIDKLNEAVYVYVTESHSVTKPDIDGKLSLNVICGQYGIGEITPGYDSTGIKNPDI